MPTSIQDFSVPRGDDYDVTFTLDADDAVDLDGATMEFIVYEMLYAVPDRSEPVIFKLSDGHGITIIPSPRSYTVHLVSDDTSLLGSGNYYHEANVIDAAGRRSTVCQGAMTVTQALNNP